MRKILLTLTNDEIIAQIASLLSLGGQLYYHPTKFSLLNNSIIYIVEMYYNRVAGVIGISAQTPQITKLCHLCVHPEHRQKGIGLKLLKKAIEYAETTFVYGEVRENNNASIKNSLHAGLKPVAKYKGATGNIILFAGRRKNIGYGSQPKWAKKYTICNH